MKHSWLKASGQVQRIQNRGVNVRRAIERDRVGRNQPGESGAGEVEEAIVNRKAGRRNSPGVTPRQSPTPPPGILTPARDLWPDPPASPVEPHAAPVVGHCKGAPEPSCLLNN